VIYYGLLNKDTDLVPGCYHTSIYHIAPLNLTNKLLPILAQSKIVVLDQNISCYNNARDYYDTIEMAQDFTEYCQIDFINPLMFNSFTESFKKNKSFCILPFITLNNNVRHCCLMKKFVDYTDFYTDHNSIKMRQQMLAGEKTDLCQYCYQEEEFGGVSQRQSYTKEWAFRLNLKSYDDVVKNTKLVRYEIFLGNYCNLQCRSCAPGSSNLIDNEYVALGLTKNKIGIKTQNLLDKIDLDNIQELHVDGGEPSINQDFLNFLKHCISIKKTDFEILINTNGVALTKEFISLIKQFKNTKMIISIDGFDQVNQYIRWPTNWEKLIRNIQTLTSTLSPFSCFFNTTLSIYNVSQLYSLYKFLDHLYPTARFAINSLATPSNLQPWNFPDKQIALENLNKIKNLKKYHTDKFFANDINGIIQRLETSTSDMAQLADFFKFNDILDRSRNVKLSDYIPELDKCRFFLA
jgi:hypothetical protein